MCNSCWLSQTDGLVIVLLAGQLRQNVEQHSGQPDLTHFIKVKVKVY